MEGGSKKHCGVCHIHNKTLLIFKINNETESNVE